MIKDPTVSALMSMQKALKDRREQLNSIRVSSTTKQTVTRGSGDNKEVDTTEPTYSIRTADKMVTAINNALFMIDQKIKESNAKTKIEGLELDFDTLMKEIE